MHIGIVVLCFTAVFASDFYCQCLHQGTAEIYHVDMALSSLADRSLQREEAGLQTFGGQ